MSDSKGAAIDEILHPFHQDWCPQNDGVAVIQKPCDCGLREAKQAILALLAQEVKRARVDELERMHEKSFGWKRNNNLISGFVEDYYERLEQLERLG